MAVSKYSYARFGKRGFDVCAVILSMFVTLPLICVVALCIALTSKGPIFFAQERMGRNFSQFKLLKFRTMVVGAAGMGPLVTKGNDPRITTIGRFLRKTKLDELPQLLNVLKGDMSIVGPRPEVEKYVQLFKDEYEPILSIRPGITDYATLEYRDEQKILNDYTDTEKVYVEKVLPAKIKLYEKYLRGISLTADLEIIFKTLWRLFS